MNEHAADLISKRVVRDSIRLTKIIREVAERRRPRAQKPQRITVEYVEPAPYDLVKAPYYDFKKNRFFAKVATNAGPRLVTCSEINANDEVVWAFVQSWRAGDYEKLMPKGWSITPSAKAGNRWWKK